MVINVKNNSYCVKTKYLICNSFVLYLFFYKKTKEKEKKGWGQKY